MYKDIIVNFIKDYFEKNGNSETKAVIGISGGKDSTVVAAACVEALGKDRVVGVLMPNGTQKDISDSYEVVKFLGIEHYEINIGDAFEGLTNQITRKLGKTTTPQYSTNTPARLRMATLYGVAAMLGGNCRVSCNGNKSECELGYFTLWGDGAGDFAPLSKLYVSEVIQAGLELGLPEHLVKKAPQDGMCGKTDEENLGFTYDEVEGVLEGVLPKNKEIWDRINNIKWKKELISNIPTIPTFCPKLFYLRKPKRALIIVDPQKDFINGSMGVGLDKWIPARDFIIDCIKNGKYNDIFITEDAHPLNHCSFKENGGLWPVHCVRESEGASVDFEILKAVNQAVNVGDKQFYRVIHKGKNPNVEEYSTDFTDGGNWNVTSYRSYGYENNALHKDFFNRTEVDVVGLCLDYCVKATANELVRPYNDPKIDSSDFIRPVVRILKRGTVAINPDAPLDLEDGVELVED